MPKYKLKETALGWCIYVKADGPDSDDGWSHTGWGPFNTRGEANGFLLRQLSPAAFSGAGASGVVYGYPPQPKEWR